MKFRVGDEFDNMKILKSQKTIKIPTHPVEPGPF